MKVFKDIAVSVLIGAAMMGMLIGATYQESIKLEPLTAAEIRK